MTKLGEGNRMTLFIYLIILFSCISCIELTEIWELGGLIRYRKCLLPFEVTVMFCLLEQLMKFITNQITHYSGCKMSFDVEYIYRFVWWGSASKVDDVTALPSRHKMADMCYYGNVMTTIRWWLCVTILHLQQYSHRLNFPPPSRIAAQSIVISIQQQGCCN